jgi:hypothetical protein
METDVSGRLEGDLHAAPKLGQHGLDVALAVEEIDCASRFCPLALTHRAADQAGKTAFLA